MWNGTKDRIWIRLLCLGSLVLFALNLYSQLPPASFNHIKRDERLLASMYDCITEDDLGFIWFGSYDGGGLYRFDGYDLRSFVVNPDHLHASLPSNRINTLYNFGNHQIHIGTHGGMAVLDIVTGTFKTYADEIKQVPDYKNLYIEGILTDSSLQCTWLASPALCRLDWKTSQIFCSGIPEGDRIGPYVIIDICQDMNDPGTLWLGTHNGLFRYYKTIDSLAWHPPPDGEKFIIFDLYQSPGGKIWVAGGNQVLEKDNRFFSYNPGDNKWEKYHLEMPGEIKEPGTGEALHVLPSRDPNLLWVSTRRTVGLFNKNDGSYQSWAYDKNNPDGLLQYEFFQSMLKDRHGRLWITSWQGIQYAKIPLDEPSDRYSNLKVAVTDVSVSNARANAAKPLIYQEGLQLEKDQRDLSLHYVLPNPLYPDEVEYEYMLEGWDTDWVNTDQRTVQYRKLRGGEYTFLVRGKERNHDWTEVTSLKISVAKKLTEYILFWIAVLLFTGGIAAGSVRYLVMRARKEEKLTAEFDKKLSEVEMQALRAQMNPHFLFNSLNSIKYYALSKDKETTADYVTKFSQLVRNILNNSQSPTISLKDEIDTLKLYIEIEHLRLEGNFDYTFDIDSSISVELAQIPPMILQPYVENAIWHGLMHKKERGRLLIQVKDLGTRIQCIIEDNGVGREHSRKIEASKTNHKKSMGLKITGDRINLINKLYGIDTHVKVVDIVDATDKPQGTRVIITVPLITDDPDKR